MCGVNACIHRRGGDVDRRWLADANRLLHHRGPDGSATHVEGAVGLGSTRLSIVDIPGGDQPLFNEDGSIALVCNGEIYNHLALRRELGANGHSFRTGSDAEVILHLYEDDPRDYVTRLIGMFAFVLVDRARGTVELVRDRLGIKPLFVSVGDTWVLASSEAKAILRHPSVTPRLDGRVVHDTLTLGFAPGPRTVFERIDEVPPATRLVYELATDRLKGAPYWTLPLGGRTSASVDSMRALLESVVPEHCIADVPVGVYASGGLDSSILAALLSDHSAAAPAAFSLAFPGSPMDESAYVDDLVRHISLRSHRVPVTGWDLTELEHAIYHLEQPQIVTLDVAQMRLSSAVRDAGVKVVLAGDGADELMGGYDHFAIDAARRRLADGRGHVAPERLADLDLELRRHGYAADFRVRYLEIAATEGASAIERFGVFPPWYAIWRLHDEIKRPLFAGGWPDTLGPEGPLEPLAKELRAVPPEVSDLDKAVHLELRSRLPSWILWKSDRNGMANSVEARVPYLDHRVVEHIGGLPASLKLDEVQTKVALRQAFARLLPPRITAREKFAFNTPFEWILGSGHARLSELLSPAALREAGLFEPAPVAALLAQVCSETGRRAGMMHAFRTQVLVGVITSQILHRRFVDVR